MWRHGGGEVQARKYHEHLNRVAGVEAVFFSPYEPQEVDVLHIIGTNYHLNEIGKYARAQGIKVAVMPVAYSRHAPWKFRLILGALMAARARTPLLMRREILHDADLVIASTNIEKSFLASAYGVSLDKTESVGIGVDIGTYLESDPELFRREYGVDDYVLCVGRVNPYKGQLAILEALRESPYPIVVVGQPDGSQPEYAGSVEAIVKASPRMKWIKNIPFGSPLLPSAYAASRCHVQFSRGEVASLVNVEAMAAGTTVIAKPLATTCEMLGDRVLYASDANAIRAAVDTAYSYSDDERRQRIASGREHVTRAFSWEAIIPRLVNCYEKLLSQSGRS
jgi:glycosyltransferase involved in cell wall biosynthesis